MGMKTIYRILIWDCVVSCAFGFLLGAVIF